MPFSQWNIPAGAFLFCFSLRICYGCARFCCSTFHSVGTLIIGGTIIGAGMFSLPVVMSGAWFLWSSMMLLVTWFCMLLSGLLYLEASLHYPAGSSFNTVTRDLLGRGWNAFNGLSVVFVLGILTYAYISASGAIIQHSLNQLNVGISARMAGLLFTLLVALFIWLGLRW